MFQAGDPGFIGPAYQAPMVLQDAENCINYYVEIAEINGAKMPVALLGTPGLNTVMAPQTYTGTLFAEKDGTKVGWVGLAYGSVLPSTDPNGNTIDSLFQDNAAGTTVLGIDFTGAALGQNYINLLTIGTTTLSPDNSTYVVAGSTCYWTWNQLSGITANNSFPVTFSLASGNSAIRGMWVLPGDTQMLVVISNAVYVATIATPATASFIASYTLGSPIGTLLTSSGQVSIRDNGQVFGGEGGYAVIVDGQYGYFYSLTNAPQTITFTGGVTSGEKTITVSSIPNGLVVTPNAIVTDTLGYIPTTTTVLYTGTLTCGQTLLSPGNTVTGYFTYRGTTYGSISPTTDTNSNTISTISQGNGGISLGINSASSLTQSYFAQITINSNTFYAADATFSFVGGVNTWNWSGVTAGLVDGNTYNVTYGQAGGTTYFTGVDFNAVTVNVSNNATGTNSSDTISIQIPIFGQITDPAFLGASNVAFIEGWLIFSEPSTRTFFTNAATPYTLLFSGLFYALKDSSTDNLVALYENIRELWLFGERTSEVWYNAGGGSFAFARIPGIGPQIGCAATFSMARMGEQLVWLARNEQGQNIVVRQVQYSWERISNHAIEHAISQYPVVTDAIGYAYEEEGHFFYVLTFPTADVTWVYDATASGNYRKACWHQRASLDSEGVYHRHRSNCFANFGDVRLVGDYENGQIYQMSRQFYTDAGMTLRAQRRSPHEWDKSRRGRVFFSSLQLEFTPGVGLQTGQGSNPQAMLRWSSDGGFTWSNEVWVTIGAAGMTRNRAIWRLLGYAYDRVWEINFSDPVPRDLIGATVYAEQEVQA